MYITNTLTGKKYDIKMGTIPERKFFRVSNGWEAGAIDKMYFENEAEYKLHRVLEDNPRLTSHRGVLISKVEMLGRNWESFQDWVQDPTSASMSF
tara:strand:- start:321 stop:605 length:285 start_codon:yes stop_codon:yes gene_type:complete